MPSQRETPKCKHPSSPKDWPRNLLEGWDEEMAGGTAEEEGGQKQAQEAQKASANGWME